MAAKRKLQGQAINRALCFWRAYLAVPGVTAVIIGARNLEQLHANLSASGWEFPRKLWLRLEQASALPVEYPQDYHAIAAAEIHRDVAESRQARCYLYAGRRDSGVLQLLMLPPRVDLASKEAPEACPF